MRRSLAKSVKGDISRLHFARRLAGCGFGAVTAESILDNIATESDIPNPAYEDLHFKPCIARTFFDQ